MGAGAPPMLPLAGDTSVCTALSTIVGSSLHVRPPLGDPGLAWNSRVIARIVGRCCCSQQLSGVCAAESKRVRELETRARRC